MNDQAIVVELLKWGMGGAVLIVIFWKFIPTLFDFLKAHRPAEDPEHKAILTRMENASEQRTAIAERLEKLERDYSALSDCMTKVRVDIGIVQAILQRIEREVCDK